MRFLNNVCEQQTVEFIYNNTKNKVLKKTKEKKYGDSEFFKIKTKNNKHTNNSIIMWI